MFAKTADKITQKLKDNNTIDDVHYEICRYGLQQGFSIILNAVSTMFRILDEHLNKERFRLIDEDTLEEIGSCISDMMVEKVRELARGYK